MIKSQKKALAYLFILIAPIAVSLIAYKRFNNTYTINNQAFNDKIGTVAGDKKTAKDTFTLPDNIPVMNNSQVLNFDSSDKNSSITYETTANEDQIKRFYKKFLDENQFNMIDQETYSKGNKELKIKIDKSIVVINYYER